MNILDTITLIVLMGGCIGVFLFFIVFGAWKTFQYFRKNKND